MWTRALAAGLLACCPAAAAEAPLSAIDWLSRSVSHDPDRPPPGEVTVQPLREVSGPVGLISPQAAGIPSGIWRGSKAEDVAALLGRMPTDMPLALADTLATLVLLRAPAEDPDHVFLTARLDALLALGRLDAAQRLIDEVGADAPELFRREFDIALLTGVENERCRALRSRPDLAPTYPARIFCLARGGDWPAAALTLETAHALDVLTEEEDALLGRFLDDGENDLLPPPERPDIVTPLVFRLYEAIGEPLSTRGLPIAFAHADLRPLNGWKTRLEAGERLYRAGAIASEDLLALYAERTPAASGGVWERVAAVQAWREAPATDEATARAAAVELLGPAGLARLVGHGDADAPTRVAPVNPEAEPDRDLSTLLDGGRRGEAALHALLRAAAAWEGDRDDLSRALATLDAAGVEMVAAPGHPLWAASQ